MKILYVPSLNPGVVQWRIENYASNILGIDETEVYVEYFYHPKSGIAWDGMPRDTKEGMVIEQKLDAAFDFFDVIIFQRLQQKAGIKLIIELKEKYPNTKIYAETDDHIGDITPSNSNADKFKDHHSNSAWHCEISDGIIASTQYLSDLCRKFNDNIYVAPNCIDPETWKFEEKELPENEILTYGYVAGGGHDEDLKIIQRGLNIYNTDCLIKVRYGGHRPKFLTDKRIDFKTVAWGIDEYPQRLYDLNVDIGLAPLRDTEFNRAKSNIKFLEWSYIGKPLIASKVEPYKETNGDITLRANSNFHLIPPKNINATKLKEDSLQNYNIKENCKLLLDWLKK
tara:strand:+ start:5172 stop:6191 length:1020 start_codon:yes stop_codon:yes gene_type:complete